MKSINGLKISLLLTGLLGVSLPLFACPDMQGTYKIENAQTQLYLQKLDDDTYKVILDIPTYSLMEKKASPVTDKDRKENTYQMPLPGCTLHIEGFGYLMPFTKGTVYHLHFDSQDYEKTIKTDFVLKLSDSPDGIMGVSKTGSSLPAKAIDAFSKK